MTADGESHKLARTLRVLIGTILFLAILAGAAWLLLPQIIDTPAVKDAFCRQISQATALHASLETMELKLGRGVEIRGHSLILRETVRGKPVVEIPFVRARLGLSEVLRGEVTVRSLVLENAQIVWGASAPWGDQGGRGMVGAKQLLGLVRLITVVNGQVLWEGGGLELREINADLRLSQQDGGIAFEGGGEVWGHGDRWHRIEGKGVVTLDGTARAMLRGEGISLSTLARSWFGSAPGLDVRGLGRLDLQVDGSFQEGRCKGTWAVKGLKVSYPNILDMPFEASEASGSFQGEWSGGRWAVGPMEVQAGPFTLTAHLRKGQEGLHGAIISGPFQFQEVIPYLGAGLVGPKLQDFFREDLRHGKGQRASFFFFPQPGQDDTGQRIGLIMEINFGEVWLTFDRDLQPIQDLGGTLVWQGDRVWFRDISGTYRGHPFRSMEARITEIGTVSLLQGRFQIDLTPEELIELFAQVTPKESSPPAGAALEGKCALDLTLDKAFLRNDPLGYTARVSIREVRGALPQIPGQWQISRGSLLATPRHFEIKEFQGKVEGSSFTVEGTIEEWAGEAPRLNLAGRAEISGQDLNRVALSHLPDIQLNPGNTLVAFSVRGTVPTPQVSLRWDLTAVGIRYGDYWEKSPDRPLVVDAQMDKTPGGAWRLVKGVLHGEQGRIYAEGWWGAQPGDRRWLQIWISEYPVEVLAERIPYLRGKVSGGKVDIHGEIYLGSDAHWLATLQPRGVRISEAVLGHEITLRKGSLVVSAGWSQADPLEIEVLGRKFTLWGSLRPLEQGFSLSGQVTGEEVDLDAWIFPPREKGRPAEEESSFALKRWIETIPISEVEFHFDRVKVLDFVFRDVTGQMATREGSVRLENASGHLEGGRVAAEGFLEGDGDFWLAGGIDEAEARTILGNLGFQEEIVEGPLSLQVGVKGRLTGRQAGKHEGNVELRIDKGVIGKFPVLANILSLMNLTQILTGRLPDLSSKGMVFRQIQGSFSLKDGVAHTEDFRIDSEAMGVTVVGDLDVLGKKCDFKVGVQPFVGFDRFVNKIPVIRHYLAGPEKAVLATYFLVKGPLADPDVTPVPFRSLGQGIIGIFRRLLQNPFQDLGIPSDVPSPSSIEDDPIFPREGATPRF